MITLSLVIPCFNEGEGIETLIDQCVRFNSYKDIEIIFVDNGSTDNTRDQLEIFLPSVNNYKLIHLDENLGYGGGILKGLEQASGEYVGWTHADMQCNPLDALNIYKMIGDSDKFFFKGKRYGRPFLDVFFTMGMSFLETLLFKYSLNDINAQPTIFEKSLYKKYHGMAPSDFSLDLYFYVLAKKEKFNIARFPVYFGKRHFGTSSWNNGFASRLKFIKRTLNFSFTLKKRINNDFH